MTRRLSIPGGIAKRLFGEGAQAPKQDLNIAAQHITNSLRQLGVDVSPDQAKKSLGGIPQLPGHGGCAIRSQRPRLRKRVNIPDLKVMDGTGGEGITISAGTGLLAGFNADATEDWTTDTNRQFIHGEDSPRGNLDKAWDSLWLIEVDPILRVFARPAGGAFDKELSDMCTEFFEMTHLMHLDPDGTGKNNMLDPTLIEDFPKGGIKLDRDQVFKMNKDSFAQFDYLGVGEADDYGLGDISFDIDIVITVVAGVKAVFADSNPFA